MQLDPSVANFEGSNDDIDVGTTQIYGCRETPLAPRMATDQPPRESSRPLVAAGGGPHASPRDGDLVAGSAWKLSRRGCRGGRLAEGFRRGGIMEVVSRRAVGEVSRVAVSGGVSQGRGIGTGFPRRRWRADHPCPREKVGRKEKMGALERRARNALTRPKNGCRKGNPDCF
jgi:hypothetical protein